MRKNLSRRGFFSKLAVGAAAGASLPLFKDVSQAAPKPLPQRILGRTGVSVSILAFGCGSRFLRYQEEEVALAALHRALDLGITYLDTAYAYGNGKSETWVGKVMATRRKEVFLATKVPDRTRDDFLRRLEGCLERLQINQVDLVHVHSLKHGDDLAKLEAPDGALKGLLEAREKKMTRFIGITSHTNGEVMAQAIERHDLDCVQIALNASRNGRFEELALPAANRKHLGVIAMKVCGQELLLGNETGKTDFDPLLRYSLSLPVTTAVVGMPKVEFIEHNVQLARNFSSLDEQAMERLRQALEPSRGPMEKQLVGHVDGPTDTPEMLWV